MSKPQVAFTLDDDVDGIVDTAIERILAENRGRCAYCGKELRFEDMQVDHIVPVWRGRDHVTLSKVTAIGDDSFENLNPACRACNFRKGTSSVEDFRRILREQCQGIMKRSFQVRQSLDFGLLEWHDMDVVFFFESYGQGEEGG